MFYAKKREIAGVVVTFLPNNIHVFWVATSFLVISYLEYYIYREPVGEVTPKCFPVCMDN